MMEALVAVIFILVLLFAWYIISEQRAALRDQSVVIQELVDKLIHNQTPPRIIEQKRSMTVVQPASNEGMSDPLSVAERKAKERTAAARQASGN